MRIKRDPDYVCECSVCGEAILAGDTYYDMPDGTYLCDDPLCMQEWSKEYAEIAVKEDY